MMKHIIICLGIISTLLLMNGCTAQPVTIHKDGQTEKRNTISESLMTKMRTTRHKSQVDPVRSDSAIIYSATPVSQDSL